jgi:hypothetical protein
MKPTKTQLALIREGVTPKYRVLGSGGGYVVGDPRTIRALKKQGLAFPPGPTGHWYDQRCSAYLTRKAYALVGAEMPANRKHPYDLSKEWP